MGKSVALVLSSGGARGVAHIGVIEGLLEEGFEITSISGSSMGAVVGGVYAAGKLKEYKEWICNLDRFDVFKLLDFTLSTQGFVRGEKVFNEMKKFIEEQNIEDLGIPLSVIATDIVNKKEVVFKKGSLYQALRASAAVPSVLKPSLIDDIELVDGGVINPLPVKHVKRKKGDILVISDVNANIKNTMKKPEPKKGSALADLLEKWNSFFPEKKKNKRLSYFDLITYSVDLMQDRISDYIIEESKPEMVVKISRDTCGTFEFHRAEQVLEHGKKQFKKALNDSGLK
ncbi:patatin-like phospholipase family protein [Fulvivirga lutea]|uniref:Patatin-like phospholipase family protein n=1 Tax=Fulvivirga lutea TaxID=2810512 RepID=A0A975A1Y9_9BACT|nr:patatin-like phospholipase family protein [Fulvivirga lutea]QSE97977.1 patatin-like phospholipase family protein [Fulvivirga lutea]